MERMSSKHKRPGRPGNMTRARGRRPAVRGHREDAARAADGWLHHCIVQLRKRPGKPGGEIIVHSVYVHAFLDTFDRFHDQHQSAAAILAERLCEQPGVHTVQYRILERRDGDSPPMYCVKIIINKRD